VTKTVSDDQVLISDVERVSIEIEVDVSLSTVNHNVVSKLKFTARGAGGYPNDLTWTKVPDWAREAIDKTVGEILTQITTYSRAMDTFDDTGG
jgi:hypothetical protein